MGILFYAPVLVVCGVCVLLAFHRAKVVSGRAFWRIQVPTYMFLCLLVVGGLYFLRVAIERKLKDEQISLSQIVANAVVRLLQPSKAADGPGPVVDPQVINSDAEKLPNVDLAKRPLIAGHIGDVVACRPGNAGRTIIYMMISLTDRGLPTSLGGWNLRYNSRRLKQQFEFIRIADREGCTWNGHTYAFHGEDSIFERAEKRLETGALVRGWAKFEVPGFLYDEIGTRDAELSVHIADFHNHEYIFTWIGSGVISTTPEYYPGVNPTEVQH